jgi:hypothetical protein
MKWCKEDREKPSCTYSISSLHHFMDLLDILFILFHGLAGYHLYIILWTCSISFLHHFRGSPWNDGKRISSKSMKWCKKDIEQVHEMMQRGYRASPWNAVKRISSKSMKWWKEDIEQLARYPLYIILWTCSISFSHHFMDLLDILFRSFHGIARYPL